MRLSVIIPVYRVEETLDRCMESIVGQTFTDMEVILVDDGSPDRCPQMCDEWAGRDSRVKVIHKRNGGLSDARNAGIDVATGDYITFADSDDYLDLSTYQHAMEATGDADLVEFPVYRHYGATWQRKLDFGNHVYASASDYWLNGRAYEHAYAWNKVYRRQLFEGVRFPVGRVFEDVAILPLLLQKARRIVTIDKGFYYYCSNGEGITSSAQGPQMKMLLEAHLKAMKDWCDDSYYMHVLNIQNDVYGLTGQAPLLPKRAVNPFATGLPASLRAKAAVLWLLGVENTCKLNQTIQRWKKPSR